MKLLIISHTSHYKSKGEIVGWGPTIQEIDHLATIFDEIVHIAPLHSGSVPKSSLPYTARNVRLHPVTPAGGKTLKEKFTVLTQAPEYISAINQEMKSADIVHVRCPAAISLIALILLFFNSQPKYRWVKYAGNWKPGRKTAFSYSFQRWFLVHNLHRGIVTINGRWKSQPGHVFSFKNPCLTEGSLQHAKQISAEKELKPPYQILFVGRLETAKGVDVILNIVKKLKISEHPFYLTMVGDGPERGLFEDLCQKYNLGNQVNFTGWQPKTSLSVFYRDAHIFLFPSKASEGWPKVLGEAMAYGAVPIASAISSIPQTLAENKAGISVAPEDFEGFVAAILHYIKNPQVWKEASRSGGQAANEYTYEYYLLTLRQLFYNTWQIQLRQE